MGNVLPVGGPDERRRQQQERTNSNNDEERCSSCFEQFSSIATTRRMSLFQEIDNNDDDNVVVDEDEIDPPVLSNSRSGSSSCLLKRTSTTATTNGTGRSSFLLSSPNPNVSSSSSSSYSKLLFTKQNLEYTDDELMLPDTPTEESDLTSGRPVWIVTTAALPWMTGTAVNPLLRAAYLANTRRKQQCNTTQVHLVLPWLERPEDRAALYGDDWRDVNVQRQEDYIRNWIHTNVGGTSSTTNAIQMHWYPARYHSALGSIFAMGDVCATTLVDPECHTTMLDVTDAICLLEEPEHLNYYRGGHWRTRFAHVCGIIHTHYEAYAEQKSKLAAPLIGAVSAWMVRAYCDKVIHLSATLPKYAPEKEVVSNVHGVREVFFQQSYTTDGDDSSRSGTQMYFLGKLLWAKGLDKILELQEVFKSMTGKYFELDIYGNGPDEEEIRQAFARSTITTTYSDLAAAYWIGDSCPYYEQQQHQQQKVLDVEPLPVQFKGRVDHATVDQMRDTGGCYKIFINPSVSEVLCTVTAEALAMGKFVVIPKHPSNAFFEPFQNCLLYDSPTEFCTQLQYAMSHQPIVLPDRSALTWEAATERLIRAASISHREAARLGRLFATRDQRLADWHIKIGQGTTGDMVRTVLGGGPVAKQAATSSSMTSFSRSSSTSTSVASPEVTTEDTTTTAITFSTGLDCPSFTESFAVATAPEVSQEFPPTPIIQQC